MLKKYWHLFLVLLIEGAALMAVEVMGAKLLAPFYGSSLYVWTAVLAITVLGLTLGYHFGGKLSEKQASEKLLAIILGIAAVLVFALPTTATAVIALTSGMALIPGICVASLLLLAPPMFCFGLVGPLVVRLMAQKMATIGNVAGTVYFTSTLGGIAATFLIGFYWIPEFGLKFCALACGLALAVLPVVLLLKTLVFPNQIEASLPTEAQTGQLSKAKTTTKAKKASPKISKINKSVYLFAALEGATGMDIKIFPTPEPEDDINILFLASIGAQEYYQVRPPLLFKGQPVGIDSVFLDTRTLDMEQVQIFHSDRPNLDRLTIKPPKFGEKLTMKITRGFFSVMEYPCLSNF